MAGTLGRAISFFRNAGGLGCHMRDRVFNAIRFLPLSRKHLPQSSIFHLLTPIGDSRFPGDNCNPWAYGRKAAQPEQALHLHENRDKRRIARASERAPAKSLFVNELEPSSRKSLSPSGVRLFVNELEPSSRKSLSPSGVSSTIKVRIRLAAQLEPSTGLQASPGKTIPENPHKDALMIQYAESLSQEPIDRQSVV